MTAFAAATGAILAASIQASGGARAQTIIAQAARNREVEERTRVREATRARVIAMTDLFENSLAYATFSGRPGNDVLDDQELQDFLEFVKTEAVADAFDVRQLNCLHGVSSALRKISWVSKAASLAYAVAREAGNDEAMDQAVTLLKLHAAVALRRLQWFFNAVGDSKRAAKAGQYMSGYGDRFIVGSQEDLPGELVARFKRYKENGFKTYSASASEPQN